jgi:hypothetical protein
MTNEMFTQLLKLYFMQRVDFLRVLRVSERECFFQVYSSRGGICETDNCRIIGRRLI